MSGKMKLKIVFLPANTPLPTRNYFPYNREGDAKYCLGRFNEGSYKWERLGVTSPEAILPPSYPNDLWLVVEDSEPEANEWGEVAP